MKYELAILDNFIEANFNPANLFSEFYEEADLLAKTKFIREERERIRFLLMAEAFKLNDDSKIQIHIRHNQKAIVFLADRLVNFKKPCIDKIGSFLKEYFLIIYDEVLACLEFLLDFVETYFCQYFDIDLNVPEYYLVKFYSEITESIRIINTENIDKKENELIQIICNNLNRYIEDNPTSLTFRKVYYLRKLVDILLLQPTNLEIELIRLNFNDPIFYKYCSKKVIAELEQVNSIKERLYIMFLKLKEFKQISTEPLLIYRLDCPNINNWLIDWLSEEIAFQEKTTNTLMVMPSNGFSDSPSQKYELNLSVGQLGLLSRLFMEFCFYDRPVYKKVASDISRVFCTKKAGKVEDLSKESVFGILEILLRMANRVREL